MLTMSLIDIARDNNVHQVYLTAVAPENAMATSTQNGRMMVQSLTSAECLAFAYHLCQAHPGPALSLVFRGLKASDPPTMLPRTAPLDLRVALEDSAPAGIMRLLKALGPDVTVTQLSTGTSLTVPKGIRLQSLVIQPCTRGVVTWSGTILCLEYGGGQPHGQADAVLVGRNVTAKPGKVMCQAALLPAWATAAPGVIVGTEPVDGGVPTPYPTLLMASPMSVGAQMIMTGMRTHTVLTADLLCATKPRDLPARNLRMIINGIELEGKPTE